MPPETLSNLPREDGMRGDSEAGFAVHVGPQPLIFSAAAQIWGCTSSREPTLLAAVAAEHTRLCRRRCPVSVAVGGISDTVTSRWVPVPLDGRISQSPAEELPSTARRPIISACDTVRLFACHITVAAGSSIWRALFGHIPSRFVQ